MKMRFLSCILMYGSLMNFSLAQTDIYQYKLKHFFTASGENSSLSGDGVIKDFEGNYLATGLLAGQSDVYFGSMVIEHDPSGPNRSFIVKYDSLSNVLWLKELGGFIVYSRAISVDAANNIYVGGYWSTTMTLGDSTYTSPPGSGNLFFSKLSKDGEFLWTKIIVSDSNLFSSIHDIKTEPDGTSYITGTLGVGNITIGQDVLNFGNNGSFIFVAKYDTSGNPVWARGAHSQQGNSQSHSLALGENKICISGVCSENCSFGSNITLSNVEGTDGFVAALDKNGNWLWAKNVGGPTNSDFIRDVEINDDGNIFISGNFKEYGNFGDTIINGQNDWWDAYISILSEEGDFLNIRKIDDTYVGSIYPSELTIDGNGNIVLIGSYGNSTAPLFLDDSTLPTRGLINIFVTTFSDNDLSFGVSRYISAGEGAGIEDSIVRPFGAIIVDNELLIGGDFQGDMELDGQTFQQTQGSRGNLAYFVFELQYENVDNTIEADVDIKIDTYPNPIDNQISFSSEKTVREVKIVNALGQSISTHFFDSTQGTIILNRQPTGNYYLHFHFKEAYWKPITIPVLKK